LKCLSGGTEYLSIAGVPRVARNDTTKDVEKDVDKDEEKDEEDDEKDAVKDMEATTR